LAAKHRLIHEGYAVTVVLDGLEALRAFDAERPDLLTVDLHLPTVSGYRLVRLFKHAAPQIPVLVVTSAAFEEAEELAKVGVEGFITEPFSLRDLVEEIQAVLVRRPRREPDPGNDPI
jgi:DNA-binding response OmpR family regulator